MSDHHYEAQQIALWHEYKDLNGHLSHDAFMERHPRENAYIVNLMKKFDGVRKIDTAAWAKLKPDEEQLRHSMIGEPEAAEL